MAGIALCPLSIAELTDTNHVLIFISQERLFSHLPKQKANIMEAQDTVNVFFEDVSIIAINVILPLGINSFLIL